MVYSSESLALAALEVLVHVDRATLPTDLVQIEIEVPDDLETFRIPVKGLPRNWQAYPASPELRRRGDEWLLGGSTSVLQVPSSVIPEESNFLLNPQHSDARKLKVVSTRAFAYDSRLAP